MSTGAPRTAELEAVLRRTGATYRQLDHWCRRGYLSPGAPGTGFHRHWPESEIRVAAMMVKLVAAGITPRLAERVARAGGDLEVAPGVWVIVGDGAHPPAVYPYVQLVPVQR